MGRGWKREGSAPSDPELGTPQFLSTLCWQHHWHRLEKPHFMSWPSPEESSSGLSGVIGCSGNYFGTATPDTGTAAFSFELPALLRPCSK